MLRIYVCRHSTTITRHRSNDSEMASLNVDLAEEFSKLNFSVFDDYLFQVIFSSVCVFLFLIILNQ